MISDYHSLIWNVQLYGLGYFEITLPATPENVSLLKEGRFLVREEDIQNRWLGAQHPEYKNCMIIRTVNIQYDADQGYVLHITGKSVKDVLSQRIIWEPYEDVEKALTGIIVTLMIENVTNPEGFAQDKLEAAEAVRSLIKGLKIAPTVDAVEVVHGRWLYDSGSGKHFCSACDENALSFKKDTLGFGEVYEVFLTDYCPNCGAKMDGERKDND